MSLKDIMTVASSDVVFAVLFIGLLYVLLSAFKKWATEQKEMSIERERYVLTMHEKQMIELKENMLHERNANFELLVEQRRSFETREAELIKVLNKNTDQLSSIADTLKDIQRNLSKLEDRVEDNFMDVWKELGSKLDKPRQ